MTSSLPALLNNYKYETLLQIAKFNGITTTDSTGRKLRKEALIERLHDRFSTQEHAQRALASLSTLERLVLERLLLHHGEVSTAAFRDELQRDDIVQPSPRSKRADQPYEGDPFQPEVNYFEDVIARLTLHGLVFCTGTSPHWTPSTKLGFSLGPRLTVPQPLRNYLPQPTLPSVDWGPGHLPAPAEETSTAIAQRDLFIYWSYVHAQAVPLTQAGLVRKRALRNINEQLLLPDSFMTSAIDESKSPKLHFIRLLLQELGLLIQEHGYLRVANPSQVPEFWKQALDERTRACLEAWIHMSTWSEITNLKVSAFDFDLPGARKTLLEQLRSIPPNRWASADRFLNRLAVVAPRLLFRAEETVHGASTVVGDHFVNPTARPSRWLTEMTASFVGGALSGPLHWLGILDISADDGRVLAFRINTSGARALDMEIATEDTSGEAEIIVQPNFQILALGPVSEATLARLEMFAERVKADRTVFEYRLSRESVYHGQKHGLSVTQIIAILEQLCTIPLPQNVLRTLQEWAQQQQRIIFHRNVTLCHTANPELLQRMRDDTALQMHLERNLTPTVALIKRGHTTALQEALLQRGILPALSPKDDHCVGRVQITPQGELRPIHEGPDLLLKARLRRLAEEREGRFYITKAAVNRAIANGTSVPEYLQQLTKLHHGPLPAAWELRIKAWGHYYGKATLRKAVLLEVKDAATADELLADEELAPLLSRFTPDTRDRLLLIRTENLKTVRRLLRKRGIELT